MYLSENLSNSIIFQWIFFSNLVWCWRTINSCASVNNFWISAPSVQIYWPLCLKMNLAMHSSSLWMDLSNSIIFQWIFFSNLVWCWRTINSCASVNNFWISAPSVQIYWPLCLKMNLAMHSSSLWLDLVWCYMGTTI